VDPLMIKKSGFWWGLLLVLGVGFLGGFLTYSFIFPPAPPPPYSVLAGAGKVNQHTSVPQTRPSHSRPSHEHASHAHAPHTSVPHTSVPAAQGTSSQGSSIEEMRTQFIALKQALISKIKDEGRYRCCLKKVCARCLLHYHRDKVVCPCADDVMAGRAPCGECIGEILEGKGEPAYASHFAKAIAAEVGSKHLDTLRKIISDKYKISVEQQR